MNTRIYIAAVSLLAAPLLAADASGPADLTAAVKKLSQQSSYAWKTRTAFGNFPPGTTTGKTDKEGLVQISMTFNDNTTEAFLKSGKGAVKRPDQGWESLADLVSNAGDQPGPGRFLARMLQNFKAPAAEAADLAGKAKEFKQDGDCYSGDLTEAGAKELLSFRGRAANAPEPKNAKGSVKFWVKEGQLAKFELKLQGTVTFNGEDRDVDRTTTVEIQDVGTTKLEVPDEAKKKLL